MQLKSPGLAPIANRLRATGVLISSLGDMAFAATA